MKNALVLLVILIYSFSAIFVSGEEREDEIKNLKTFFPEGPMEAEVMGPAGVAEATVFIDKWQQGLRRNPEWWAKYMEDNVNTRPLPYHENFGITEQEYSKILKVGSANEMEPYNFSINMDIRHINESEIQIKFKDLGDGGAPVIIDTEVLELKVKSLRIPEPEFTFVDDNKKGGVFGAHSRWSWSKQQGEYVTGNYSSFSFSIVKKKSNNRVYIYYQNRELKNGVRSQTVDHIMMIPDIGDKK